MSILNELLIKKFASQNSNAPLTWLIVLRENNNSPLIWLLFCGEIEDKVCSRCDDEKAEFISYK